MHSAAAMVLVAKAAGAKLAPTQRRQLYAEAPQTPSLAKPA